MKPITSYVLLLIIVQLSFNYKMKYVGDLGDSISSKLFHAVVG